MDITRIPKPGEFYRHFKDKLYQIITVASDSETGEQLIVYQALYGDFKTYVRPLTMFVSEVDHVKYPEVSQKYRFELVRIQNGEHIASPTTEKTATQTATQIAAQTAMTDVQTATLTEKTDAQTATFITEQTVAHTIPHIQPHILDRTQVQIQESGTNSSSIAYRRERKEDERIEQSTFDNTPEGSVNALLLKFLDAPTYSKKLEVISSNTKHLNDRLINDMAVAIDCMVEDGPLDQRIHELIYCLQAMCRFEDRRQR